MDPLLIDLVDGGAGITINGKTILGFGWSDDLNILTTEDKLQDNLNLLAQLTGKYRKKTNDSKVFVLPLCRPLKKQKLARLPEVDPSLDPRTGIFKLGDAPIKLKKTAKILGFLFEESIQGTTKQLERARIRALAAVAHVQSMKMYIGKTGSLDALRKLHDSLIVPVLTANLTSGLPRGALIHRKPRFPV